MVETLSHDWQTSHRCHMYRREQQNHILQIAVRISDTNDIICVKYVEEIKEEE